MNHNKNFHLASVFYSSGHTAFCLVSVTSCVTATVTITGLICSLLLLIDFESFDRLYLYLAINAFSYKYNNNRRTSTHNYFFSFLL